MPKKSLPSLLTVRQAAAQLQLCHEAVRRAIWKGQLTACRVGGAIRISQVDLDDYIARGRGIRVRPQRHKDALAS